MMLWHKFWRRITTMYGERSRTTQYTRALEAEVTRQRAEVARQGAEIARLRAENRALLNSILGIAGIPPIPVDRDPFIGARHGSASLTTGAVPADPNVARLFRGEGVRDAATFAETACNSLGSEDPSYIDSRPPGSRLATHGDGPPAACQVAVPLRRRSWHQINQMLELQSMKNDPPPGTKSSG